MGNAIIKIRIEKSDDGDVPQDLYEVLGVKPWANDQELKKAYRIKSKKYHPDRNPGDKKAAEWYAAVDRAYIILSDPEKRAYYDEHGTFEESHLNANREVKQALHLIQRTMITIISQFKLESERSVKNFDLRKEILQALEVKRKTCEEDIERLKTMKDEVEEAGKRFKKRKKAKKDNVFPAICKTTLHGIDWQIKHDEDEIEMIAIALDFVSSAEYDWTKLPEEQNANPYGPTSMGGLFRIFGEPGFFRPQKPGSDKK